MVIITGRVRGHVNFPEHPERVGEWGLVGGEDVWVHRGTFRSPTEAARWCERILAGEAKRPRWQAAGTIVEPHTAPGWYAADIVVCVNQGDTVTYEWTGAAWEETR